MNKPTVCRVRIIIDDCDGGHQEISSVVPEQVSNDVAVHLMEWRKDYVGRVDFLQEYFKAEEEFISKEKGDKLNAAAGTKK